MYFSIDQYRKKGHRYGQLIDIPDKSHTMARINNDEYDKNNVRDFALWKTKKAGEPSWNFTLQGHNLDGRPGWHIECSAMSTAYLGQPFDIHTGGVDLKFPHHENEIAQSTGAANGVDLAQFFVHSEHLLVDNQKMSKSLNNFITLDDIVGKGFDPLAFRLLVLQAHYRTQAHFSWTNLEAAQHRLQNLKNISNLRFQPHSHASTLTDQKTTTLDILPHFEDDLNTPQALEEVSKFVNDSESTVPTTSALEHFTTSIDDLFGLDLSRQKDISDHDRSDIAKREEARSQQNWQLADEIRKTLEKKGIRLKDYDQGTIWFRQ